MHPRWPPSSGCENTTRGLVFAQVRRLQGACGTRADNSRAPHAPHDGRGVPRAPGRAPLRRPVGERLAGGRLGPVPSGPSGPTLCARRLRRLEREPLRAVLRPCKASRGRKGPGVERAGRGAIPPVRDLARETRALTCVFLGAHTARGRSPHPKTPVLTCASSVPRESTVPEKPPHLRGKSACACG